MSEAAVGFHSDEQLDDYREALATERAGYEHRVEAAKAAGDEVAALRYEKRAEQVDAALEEVKGLSVEGTSEEIGEKKSSRRKKSDAS